MKKRTFFLCTITLFLIHSIFAQTAQNDSAIAEIDSLTASVRKYIEAEGPPHMIIADAADYNKTDKPVWKVFNTEADFEAAREKKDFNNIAYLWYDKGVPVAANFTYSSESGDWAQYVKYIFRPGGTVAHVNRELRTFMGDIVVERNYYFSESGKILKETKNFRDLMTDKPLAEPKDFMDMDVDIYKKVGDLPFPAEMSKPQGGGVNDVPHGTYLPEGFAMLQSDLGDLNGDGIEDLILQGEKEGESDDGDDDRILLIAFGAKDGTFKEAARSLTIVRCKLCGGVLGGGSANIEVKNGVLDVSQMYGSREGVNYTHRFRLEPETGRFRLIGEEIANFDRATGATESKSINYLTGKQIITKTQYNQKTDKDIVLKKEEKALPKGKKYFEDVNYNNY